jgi:ribose transport system substrate-binding protein
MIKVTPKPGLLGLVLFAAALTAHPAKAQDAGVQAAKAIVAEAAKSNAPWRGPVAGPAGQKGKFIVYVSADQRNGGIRGVGLGVEEAAATLGWKVRTLDGQGTVSGRSSALQQAIALQPQGIVLGGIDAKEQAELLKQITAAGIKIVGWHSTAAPGPDDQFSLFANITTQAADVAKAAASYAVAQSGGKAGVVIFTDSVYAIAIAKSDAMAEVIKTCGGCKLLSVEDTPLAEASTRMPQLSTSLLQRFGAEWTHSLSINDLTFDFMTASLQSAGIAKDGDPKNISAGDGSEAAFQRIRDGFYQAATVAEPLNLHGWEVVDEMNRALAGEKWSGFVAPVHLVLKDNIGTDGGAKNTYDPDNGYRDIYKKIWAVK